MIIWKNNKKAAFCRSLVAVGVLVTLSALRADENDSSKAAANPSATTTSTTSTRQSDGPKDTATCIQDAAKMNASVIKFGELAAQKGENPELKRFGQTLAQDHRKAQAKLQTIASKHHVTLSDSDSLDAKCQQQLSKLQGLSGREFDQEFVKGALEGHAMAAAHLQKATQQSTDPDLSAYARNMLTEVKDHQRQARQIAKDVGVDQDTISSLESKANEGVGTPGAAGTESSTATSPSKDSTRQQNK